MSKMIANARDHSLLSSYREKLLEHLFVGEVMRYVWLSRVKRLEVLKPQVDDGGYDLVLEGNGVVRHIQLKATFRGSSVKRYTVNRGLASKPSGCVIVLGFDADTLELGPYLWFGAPPGQPLPGLDGFAIGKHTKGNAAGTKLPKANHRVIPLSAFKKAANTAEVCALLFGKIQ